ncbi:ubiquinone oxidoreductase 20 kd subunit [Lenzites betulinus]|nr:ubiquinone oxidoreductase 20 kd subunit [Lenzites betulinus]
MLARRALQGLARPLTRLSSTSTPVAAHEAATPATAVQQAPNFATTWSTSQRPRPQAHSGPRFEQTIMELQPNPLSAMEMIAQEPIRVVNGRKAVCDGGGGPLGHPKIFINLDKPGPRACGYCGLRFEQAPHHHH